MGSPGRVERYLGVGLAVSFVVAGIWWRASGYSVGTGLAIVGVGIVAIAAIVLLSRQRDRRSQ